MADHEGLPVSGYTNQSANRVNLVNANKVLEERVLRQIEAVVGAVDIGVIDGRSAALARTSIQEGFMWLSRSIFQPTRVNLPED